MLVIKHALQQSYIVSHIYIFFLKKTKNIIGDWTWFNELYIALLLEY